MGAFTLLHRPARPVRSGPDGALFPISFFEDEEGEVTAFVPVHRFPGALPARAREVEIPAITAAVAVHDGPFGDLDRTYGALGTWVLDRAAGADGPIREYYLPTGDPDDLLQHTTEVCRPVTPDLTAGRSRPARPGRRWRRPRRRRSAERRPAR